MMFIFFLPFLLIPLYLWYKSENGKSIFTPNSNSAIEILKQRYAKGEIEKKEFDDKMSDLNK